MYLYHYLFFKSSFTYTKLILEKILKVRYYSHKSNVVSKICMCSGVFYNLTHKIKLKGAFSFFQVFWKKIQDSCGCIEFDHKISKQMNLNELKFLKFKQHNMQYLINKISEITNYLVEIEDSIMIFHSIYWYLFVFQWSNWSTIFHTNLCFAVFK